MVKLFALLVLIGLLGGPVTEWAEPFDGDPAQPTAWQSDRWHVVTLNHPLDVARRYAPDAHMSDHGPDCSAPPAQHEVTAYSEQIYQCRNHVMLGARSGSYQVSSLIPAALVVVDSADTVISWDMSTGPSQPGNVRGYDWIEACLMPPSAFVLNPSTDAQASGMPVDAVCIRMRAVNNAFMLFVTRAGELETDDGTHWVKIEDLVPLSATTRQPFRLTVSATHVTFCMGLPDGGEHCWVDHELSAPLAWDRAVFSLSHHSSHPEAACETCGPVTWHIDNVTISRAESVTFWHVAQEVADSADNAIEFDAQPFRRVLWFAALGENVQARVNGRWVTPTMQPAELVEPGRWATYRLNIPAGVSSVVLRADGGWYGEPIAREFVLTR